MRLTHMQKKSIGLIKSMWWTLCILFLSQSSVVLGQTDENRSSATQRLNSVLFKQSESAKLDAAQTGALAQRILGPQALALTSKVDGVEQRLVKLADRVSACQASCTDRGMLSQTLNRSINRDVGTAVVILPTADSQTTVFLFDDLITAHCTDKKTIKCFEATELAIDLWRLAGHFRAMSKTLNEVQIAKSNARLSDLDARWQSYKDDTLPLWPHETLLSSMVFRQNQRGFSEPPNYKLLALRPSLGLSYFSDGSPDFRPSINVHLLGIYWWQYQGNTARSGRGISATAVWGGDDTALGLTYHHGPRFSATLARSDDNDVVLSVSIQLAHYLFR